MKTHEKHSHSHQSHSNKDALTKSLGWFSIGLGLAELAMPRALSRLIGIRPRPELMAFMGIREIANGIGILASRRPGAWLWGRVAGDAIDLALLGTTLSDHDSDEFAVETAMAAVAGVTIVDIIAARRATRHRSDAGHIVRSIIINKPPREVYDFWRNLENLPKFMRNVVSVTSGANGSHWVVRSPVGGKVEWDAEIFDDKPGSLISWRTIGNPDVSHAGTVRFDDAPGQRGTIVRVNLRYHHPAARLVSAVATLAGESPEQKVRGDLFRLKQLLETGEVTTTEGQSSGRAHSGPGFYDDPTTTTGALTESKH